MFFFHAIFSTRFLILVFGWRQEKHLKTFEFLDKKADNLFSARKFFFIHGFTEVLKI